MRGLLIKKQFLEKILSGKKSWEIRSSRTNIRGPIGLICSGTGTVVGVCELIDCIGPLTNEQFRRNARKAGLHPAEASIPRGQLRFAWVLSNIQRLNEPVPYSHPSGAIIWVKLMEYVARRIMRNATSDTSR
jgi:hypothetical protein